MIYLKSILRCFPVFFILFRGGRRVEKIRSVVALEGGTERGSGW